MINVGFRYLYLFQVLLQKYLHRAFYINHISLLLCPAASFPSSTVLCNSFLSKHLCNLSLTNIPSGLYYLEVKFCLQFLFGNFNHLFVEVFNKLSLIFLFFFSLWACTKGFPSAIPLSSLKQFLTTVIRRK